MTGSHRAHDRYDVHRFIGDCILTLILWAAIWGVWYVLSPPGGLWWVCLIIAAVVVFLGEIIVRNNDGDWDFW